MASIVRIWMLKTHICSKNTYFKCFLAYAAYLPGHEFRGVLRRLVGVSAPLRNSDPLLISY